MLESHPPVRAGIGLYHWLLPLFGADCLKGEFITSEATLVRIVAWVVKAFVLHYSF